MSDQQAAEDIELFHSDAGVEKRAKRDWFIVRVFAMSSAEATVEQLSVDGGNIRIRTAKGEPCS